MNCFVTHEKRKNTMNTENVILIGMPGSGKSTVGVVLAKMLGYDFVDSDLLIQKKTGKLLWQILEEVGNDGFARIEEEINASLDVHHCVIATGGSVCYEAKAMEHLQQIGTVIYLSLDCEALHQRLGDLHQRGVVLKEGQSLEDLYEERRPLYEKYAHIVVNSDKPSVVDVIDQIKESMKQ